mgnify:FL=1
MRALVAASLGHAERSIFEYRWVDSLRSILVAADQGTLLQPDNLQQHG